jgi:molybdopterin converting factor subunit 1
VVVTIRLFARLREIAGDAELQRTLHEGATVADAWDGLARDFEGLRAYGAIVSCAVNEDYAKLTTSLKNGDEVAFLPPVSGG